MNNFLCKKKKKRQKKKEMIDMFDGEGKKGRLWKEVLVRQDCSGADFKK